MKRRDFLANLTLLGLVSTAFPSFLMANSSVKKVAILAANGTAGSLITQEALNLGLDITAFIRTNHDKIDAINAKNGGKIKIIQKDIFKLEEADLMGFDAVLDAFGEWQNPSLHLEHAKHLVKIMAKNPAKLVIIGGAGSLYMDASHSTRLMDTPDFPQKYMPIASAAAAVLDFMRTSEINWVFVSPAAEFVRDLPATYKFEIIGEEFKTNSRGESKIGYADFAIAFVQIATNDKLNKTRVGVIGL